MRARSAFLVAPLAAPLVFWGGSVIIVLVTEPQARTGFTFGAAGHSLFFVLLFGVPLSYLAAAMVGIPLYVGLQRAGLLRWWSVVGGGAVAGALIMPLAPLFGEWSPSLMLVGALIGSVPSGLFYWLTVPRPANVSKAPERAA